MWRPDEDIRRLGAGPRLQRRQALGLACASLPALLMGKTAFGGQGFPVRIEHAFGETILAQRPRRIVTLGWGGEDAVIALGAVPVGMTGYPFWSDGIATWNRQGLGRQRPILMNARLDYEQIAVLAPDVILAVYSGVDDLAYTRLSRIAPVVAYRGKPWTNDWRDQAKLAGRVLDKAGEAEQRIRSVEGTIDRLAAAFPALGGKTFALISHFPRQNGVDVYLAGDRRLEIFERLGMKLSSRIASLGRAEGGRYSRSIGLEHIDMLDCDLLVAWFAAGLENALSDQPLLRMVAPIRRNALVSLDTPEKVWSVLTPTIRSIPHGFTRLLPELATASIRSGE